MSQLQVLQDKMKGLLAEAGTLQQAKTDGSITDDQRARVVVITGEIKDVGAEIDRIKQSDIAWGDLATAVSYAAKQPAGDVAPLLQRGGADDHEQRKSMFCDRSFMRDFAKTDGYKRIARQGFGYGTTGGFKLNEWLFGDGALLKGDEDPERVKTLVYEGATANIMVTDRLPGVYRGDSRINRVRDAFLAGRTNSTNISFVRENVVTNNAAGVAEASTAGASPGASGAQFPESAITFTVDSASVKSIGHMIPITREMMMDVPLMESYVNDRMIEMLEDKIDAQLLTGAGTNDLTGLYNVSGITALNAAYFTANPLASAGQPGENVDRLRRARTYHWVTNKARASHVLINPYNLEEFDVVRDQNGQYLYPDGIDSKIRMTVVETESATVDLPIVLDKRFFSVVDAMDTAVEITDSNREFFEYRILALAVWWRGALAPFRPAAAATVAFA